MAATTKRARDGDFTQAARQQVPFLRGRAIERVDRARIIRRGLAEITGSRRRGQRCHDGTAGGQGDGRASCGHLRRNGSEDLVEDVYGAVDLRRLDGQRRQQADDLLVGPVDQQAPLARLTRRRAARRRSTRSRASGPSPRTSTIIGCFSRPACAVVARSARQPFGRARSGRGPSAVRARRPPPASPAGCRHRCCRGRRRKIVCATCSETSAAPIGTPDPSALPTEIRSGFQPSACEWNG